jgi:hypothetical protein
MKPFHPYGLLFLPVLFSCRGDRKKAKYRPPNCRMAGEGECFFLNKIFFSISATKKTVIVYSFLKELNMQYKLTAKVIIMKCFYVSILSFVLTSCFQNRTAEKESFREFPLTVYLEHEKIKTNSSIYAVGGMILMDSVLLTVDIKADTFFQVYRLPAFNPVGGYVSRGGGPNEEIMIDPFISPVLGNSYLYRSMSAIKIMNFNVQTNSMDKSSVIELPDHLLDL